MTEPTTEAIKAVLTRLAERVEQRWPCTNGFAGDATCMTNDGTGLWCDNCQRRSDEVAAIAAAYEEMAAIAEAYEADR